MLDSIVISNYRLFEELKVERLARVNLITGKNGTGKSCLLEAIHVYAKNANPDMLLKLISSRDEMLDIRKSPDDMVEREPVDIPFRHLFRGHLLPDVGEEGIRIGTLDSPGNLKIHTQYQSIERTQPGLFDSEDADYERELVIAIEVDGSTISVSPTFYTRSPFGVTRFRNHPNRYLVHYVPAKGLEEPKTALLWDKINLTEQEGEVIRALHIIHSDITGVALVGDHDRSRWRFPIVRMEGMAQRVPLRNLGDGAQRLFHIILALVNAENGILLIDEAENGLHWSVHRQLWEIVFRLAARLNIQVFATTHSKDCIAGFHAAWQASEEIGAFFRLDADPEQGAVCTPYLCRTLGNALNSGVEMR